MQDIVEKPGRWRQPPEEHFFLAGRDGGLSWLKRPGWIMRRVGGARVRQYACSDFDHVQAILERNLEPRWVRKDPAIFEINTVPAVAENLVCRGGGAEIGGKCLLNGAAGDRIFSRYLKHNPGMPAFRRANRFFARAREETGLDLPVAKGGLRRLPVAIECRNRTNFYHFMTESLPQLVHFAQSPASEITFHCRNADPSGFSQGFIEALFPRIAPRVRFSDSMGRYDRAVIALNFRHMAYANGDPRIAGALADTGGDTAWQDLGAHVRRRKFLFKNSYDISLRLLREHALALVDPALIARMPRKIWVSRDNRDATINRREMPGEKQLVRRLERHGFQQVYFEHMSPMEQIAAIHAADVICAAHGAFFAHMIFARPDAHVIEVGSIQTQMHRWGDFLGNAHAAGCRYSTVFADTASEDPGDIRSITEGLVGVQVGKRAIDLICRLATGGQFD